MSQTIEILASLGVKLKKTSSTNGGEWHGPCPICEDGTDRFFVSPDHPKYGSAVYYCRRCEKGGKVSKLIARLGGDPSTLPAQKSPPSISRGKNPALNRKLPPSSEWQSKLKAWINTSSSGVGLAEPYRRRGISEKTVKELGLGLNGKDRELNIAGEKCRFPEGMVLPNYRGEELYGVQIRQWLSGSGYHYFKGSTPIPWHYTRLEKSEAPMVVVESALDAVILYQEAGDLIHAVAMGSAQARPDSYLGALIKKSSQLCVCMDYDDAGIEAVQWWKDRYPDAVVCYSPTGKDIGDYHLAGGSVRDWVRDMITTGTAPDRPRPEIDFYRIDNAKDAEDLIGSIRQSGITPGVYISAQYLGLGVDGQAFSIDLAEVTPDALKMIEDICVITHDGVAFTEYMAGIGLQCRRVESTRLQFLALSGKLWDLDKLAEFRLGYSGSYYAEDIAQIALNAYICRVIYQVQDEALRNHFLDQAYRLYADAQPAVALIRMTGFGFDTAAHRDLYTYWQSKLDTLDPEASGYGRLKSRLATYGDDYAVNYCDPKTGRIYTDFDYKETPTARFGTKAPNLMGIPKDELRKVFHAPEGKVLIGADYSQIDLRVAAMITLDTAMIKAFEEGTDIHAMTAAAIYGVGIGEVNEMQRSHAKKVNYESVYGSESHEAKQARKRLASKFPRFCNWIITQINSNLETQQFTANDKSPQNQGA